MIIHSLSIYLLSIATTECEIEDCIRNRYLDQQADDLFICMFHCLLR